MVEGAFQNTFSLKNTSKYFYFYFDINTLKQSESTTKKHQLNVFFKPKTLFEKLLKVKAEIVPNTALVL